MVEKLVDEFAVAAAVDAGRMVVVGGEDRIVGVDGSIEVRPVGIAGAVAMCTPRAA